LRDDDGPGSVGFGTDQLTKLAQSKLRIPIQKFLLSTSESLTPSA
jgi:hypothetical protein